MATNEQFPMRQEYGGQAIPSPGSGPWGTGQDRSMGQPVTGLWSPQDQARQQPGYINPMPMRGPQSGLLGLPDQYQGQAGGNMAWPVPQMPPRPQLGGGKGGPSPQSPQMPSFRGGPQMRNPWLPQPMNY